MTAELVLYVAGQTPACLRARQNLERLLAAHERADVRLEVRDVVDHVDAAESDHVVFTPTLIVRAGRVETRALGDLADSSAVEAILTMVLEKKN